MAGLLPWTLVSQGVNQSSNSLVSSANLIKKVYFPRLILPASAVLAGLVDFLFAGTLLGVLMAIYGVAPGAAALALPLLLLLAVTTALGLGMWLATLNVEYRDVRYVVPFFVQIWLFVTPVIYPMSRVTDWLTAHGLPAWLYGLNPMVGVVQGFRWALLGAVPFPGEMLLAGAAVALLLLGSGALYLRRMENNFADVV
jgi:lipopolysaccharide transport system permease protein